MQQHFFKPSLPSPIVVSDMKSLRIRKRSQIIQERLSRGLLIKLLLDKMSWKGIRIEPYLVMIEQWSEACGKQFETGYEGFETGFLEAEDMGLISSARDWHEKEFYIRKLAKGDKCFGIKKDGRLAGFTWADFDEFSYDGERFRLNPGEAYLYDMWTIEAFRGLGLAPLLRYRFYEALHRMGIKKIYSTTAYFNTPSVKFKAKLGARCVKLGLYIEIYNRYRLTFKVWRYAQGRG